MNFVLRLIAGKNPLRVEMTDANGNITMSKRFPLDRDSCMAVGKLLFDLGAEHWSCRSSIDFPEEIVPRCRLDIRELVLRGYHKAYNHAVKPQRGMLIKALKFLYASKEFVASLSVEEEVAWADMYKRQMSELKNGKKPPRGRKTRS